MTTLVPAPQCSVEWETGLETILMYISFKKLRILYNILSFLYMKNMKLRGCKENY